jgi:hypothetical protein
MEPIPRLRNEIGRSWGSSVNIVSRQRVRRPGFDSSVHTGSGSYTDSYPMGNGGPPSGLKRAGREPDHLPPSSVEAKNARSCTFTPLYVFMAWCLVKYRDFTFCLACTFPSCNNLSKGKVMPMLN